MKLVFILISIVALFSKISLADSAVWKVENGKNTLYIAGTLHLLRQSDYPLPNEFHEAFKASDIIYFETDMAKLTSPQFQQLMLKAMFNNGKKLQKQLSLETWNRLKNALAVKGITLEGLNDFKVSMALLTLTLAEFQTMGFTAPGVDQTFHDMSKQKLKPQMFLETPEEQLAFLADMGSDNPEKVTKYTLDDLQNMPKYVAKLKEGWRKGDLDMLFEHGLKDMQTLYPSIYSSLIKTRNENWLAQIAELIKTPEKEALYVGALHLPGKDGLLARLKDMGFTVRQL